MLADVQAAAGVDRLFPLTLGSQGGCAARSGGNIATNAGGTAVLRYGMMRSQVLGLEVMLPDRRVWDGLRALRKDNTGYDLKQLFIGAEGTLGVVTAAVLALQPAARATAWVALRDVAAAAELLGVLRDHGGDRLTTGAGVAARARPRRGGRPHRPAVDPIGVVQLVGSPVRPARTWTPRWRPPWGMPSRRDWSSTRSRNSAQRSGLWALRERGVGGPGGVRPDGQARRVGADHPAGRVRGPHRPGGGGAPARDAAVRLRPRRRRQPALQPDRPADMSSEEFLTHAAPSPTSSTPPSRSPSGASSAEHGLGRSKAAAAAAYQGDVEVALMRAVKDAPRPG